MDTPDPTYPQAPEPPLGQTRVEAPPLTWEYLMSQSLGRHFTALERRGITFVPDDLPALNAYLTAHPTYTSVSPNRPDFQDRALDAYNVSVRDAMTHVGAGILASGVAREIPELAGGPSLTPDPQAYPSGLRVQEAFTDALRQLDALAEVDALAAINPDAPPIRVEPFGRLFTEHDVADLLQCSVALLRQWRAKSLNLSFVKWPGKRGLIRYHEAGIREMLSRYLQASPEAPQ